MAYSLGFRAALIESIEAGKSWNEVLQTFSIDRMTLSKWLKKHRSGEDLADAPRRAYKAHKIDSDKLIQLLEKTPDATLNELAACIYRLNRCRVIQYVGREMLGTSP